MTPEELHRFAALATQVALLHTALRRAREWMGGPMRSREQYENDVASLDAALNASEPDCAQLIANARALAEAVSVDTTGDPENVVRAHVVLDLLERLEGKHA